MVDSGQLFLKGLKGSFIYLPWTFLVTPHMFVLFLDGKNY